jgi:formyltetrahydrofolate deformylase
LISYSCTGGLDEGPIIVQDVATVNHAVTVAEFIAVGRDIERRVLVKAVKLFSEERLFLVGDKTVVF